MSPDPPLIAPPLARLRVRLLALVYEGLILASVLFVATAVFTTVFGDSSEPPMHFVLQGFLFLVAGAYFVGSWTGGRRTLPMRTWRLHLLDVHGGNLGVGRASVRYAIAAAGIVLGGIGIVWAFFDRDRQFLHDRIAGTRIVADTVPQPVHTGPESARR